MDVEPKIVSSAAWCDAGNHAFRANEPGSESMAGSQFQKDGTRKVVELDICARCVAKRNEMLALTVEPASE